jgi:His/Glu/Gln/Arg/opine family amino acid ABC transporter permease subunit
MNYLGGAQGLLWQGFLVTLEISGVSLVASCIIGILIGVPAATEVKIVQWMARVYIEIWRGLPQLIVMFIVFFVLPGIGVSFGPVFSGIVGLSLWGSANFAEIVRGGFKSIRAGQQEAARALGFTWPQQMLLVIAPQAFRRIVPPSLGLAAAIIQGSTIASLIGAADILEQGHRSIARLLFNDGSAYSLRIMIAVMAAFFCICYPLILLGRYVEQRLAQDRPPVEIKRRGLARFMIDGATKRHNI